MQGVARVRLGPVRPQVGAAGPRAATCVRLQAGGEGRGGGAHDGGSTTPTPRARPASAAAWPLVPLA